MSYRDRPDKLLGVNFGTTGSGGDFKEFFKLGPRDTPVTKAFLRGFLTKREAAILNIIHQLAPDDDGTNEYIISYIASTMGIGGRQQRLALMSNVGVAVQSWEDAILGEKVTKVPPQNVPQNGHNGNNNGQPQGGYDQY